MSKKPSEKTVHAWICLHRAHRLLLDRVENALKTEGLPPLDWYDVLLELQRGKSEGLRQFEIGDKVLLNKHNLSRLLDRLENEQLLSRYACAEDKRGNRIKITDKGEKLLKQMWPVYSQSIQEYFGERLNANEIFEMSRVLEQLLNQTNEAV